MAFRRAALLAAVLATGAQTSAADSSRSKAEALGKALFAQDRAASLATDRLLETSGQVPHELRGWVTLPSGEGWRVFFVQDEGGVYCTRLNVLVNEEEGAGPLRRSETCEPLTADQRAMFLARQAALSALRTRCSDAYNTVVLPYEGKEAGWAVYLLAATQEARKVVVGGHVRVLVRDGGQGVVDYQQLSKSCLTLEMPSPDSGKQVALVVTHVLDDHPIETHVFLSLLHDLKLLVMTESSLWSVDKGRIKLLMDGDEFKDYLGKAKKAHDNRNGGGND